MITRASNPVGLIVGYRRAWNAIKPDRLNPAAHRWNDDISNVFPNGCVVARDFPCVTPNAKLGGLTHRRDGRIPFTLQLRPGQISALHFGWSSHIPDEILFYWAQSSESCTVNKYLRFNHDLITCIFLDILINNVLV